MLQTGHLLLHRGQTGGVDAGLVGLGLQLLGPRLERVVPGLPRLELALVVVDLRRQSLVLALHDADRLRQLDDFVLELVGYLLEVPRLLAHLLVGPSCAPAPPDALDEDHLPAVQAPRAQLSPRPPRPLDRPGRVPDPRLLDDATARETSRDGLREDDAASGAAVILALPLSSPCALDRRRGPGRPRLLRLYPRQVRPGQGLEVDDRATGLDVLPPVVLAAEVLLDHDGALVQLRRAQVLEVGEHAGSEEDLGQAGLVLVDAVLVLRAEGRPEDRVGHGPDLGRPARRRNEHVVPQRELLVRPPRRVSGAADPNRLEHAAGPKLAQHHRPFEPPGFLGLVRLDAADVVHVGRVDRVHEFDQRRLEDASERRLAVHGDADAATGPGPGDAHRPGRGRVLVADGGGGGEDLLEEDVGRMRQHVHVLVRDGVPVLLDEAFRLVRDVDGVVADGEGGLAEAWLLVEGVLVGGEVVVQLGDELVVRAHRQARFLVEQRQHAHLAFDQVDAGLVVGEVDELPVDLLAEVLLLFELEDVLVELLLQLLVGEVDAELFEGILGKVLEAVDVEHADEGVDPLEHRVGREAAVDDVDEPVEQARVDELGDGVSHDGGLLLRQVRHDLLAPGHELLLDGPPREGRGVDAQQGAGSDEGGLVGREGGVGAGGTDLDVAQVQQRGEDTEDLGLAVVRDPDLAQRGPCRVELGSIVDAVDGGRATLVEVVEVLDGQQPQSFPFRVGRAGDELIEDVIVALLERLEHQPRPLEEVGSNLGPDDAPGLVEHDLDVLAEPGRVVVPRRLGVAKGLHDRVRREDLLLGLTHGVGPALGPLPGVLGRVSRGEVPHDVLGADRLTGSGFS